MGKLWAQPNQPIVQEVLQSPNVLYIMQEIEKPFAAHSTQPSQKQDHGFRPSTSLPITQQGEIKSTKAELIVKTESATKRHTVVTNEDSQQAKPKCKKYPRPLSSIQCECRKTDQRGWAIGSYAAGDANKSFWKNKRNKRTYQSLTTGQRTNFQKIQKNWLAAQPYLPLLHEDYGMKLQGFSSAQSNQKYKDKYYAI